MDDKEKYKLARIEIKGFKSIGYEPGVDLNLGDINLMLGANGAGKSNVLGFFNLLGQMMRGNLQKYVASHGGPNMLLHYGMKKTPEMTARLAFGNKDESQGDISYFFSLSASQGSRLIIAKEGIGYNQEQKVIPLEGNFLELALSDNAKKEIYGIEDFLKGLKAYQFNDSSMSGFLRQSSVVGSAQYLQKSGDNLASFLYFLKNSYPDSYKRIVEYVRMVVPRFKDFYLQPDGNLVSLNWTDDSLNDYVLTAEQFSDGSIRFIALATLLLQPSQTMPPLLLIDEPELGLHPYAINVLSELIREASLKVQLLISTQSERLIDLFEPNDTVVVERDELTDSTATKRCDKSFLSDWLKEYTLSELWEKNVIGGRPL
ncbi:MAG: AAA family ATPase [Bacteroidales bacterium]|nr:AAA family ATPase [Bacteroidales bacterium]